MTRPTLISASTGSFASSGRRFEAFLDKQLPAEVDRAFETVTGEERDKLRKHAEQLAKLARESVADDAILPSGEPNPKYGETKAVKEYAEARKSLGAAEVSEAQRAEVFNHLYAFFSRYYDEGDFIPRRFFGARPAYAVPYNGEEVLFHWANRDQYYVKSGEAFRDYAFTLNTLQGEYRVRFKLAEATTSKDNTKGDTRFFFPRPHETAFDKTTRALTVPFEYRLPTEPESSRYGAKGKAQEAILDAFEEKILDAVPDAILKAAFAEPSPNGREKGGETPSTLLRRRLAHFTRKNTADFFVHKNLGAFLRQEMEFFIRDQIVHEADLEGDFETKRRMLRVFRKLAGTIITFLAQVEDAQKRLFEKKKFVLRTDYLVPIQNVPRNLWKEVLANKAQLEEWKHLFSLEPKSDLFNLKGRMNENVLGQHPTLVVDTRHFSRDFTAQLLEAVEDLDEWTDGVLLHSENFQALNLMQARYREQVKCIYIDPPYNTGADDFIYKDSYRHSSWLAMLANRFECSRVLMPDDSALFVSMDDGEQANLRQILDTIFGPTNFVANVIWQKKYSPQNDAQWLSDDHDFLLVYAASKTAWFPAKLPRTGDQDRAYVNPDNDLRGPWKSGDYTCNKTADRRPNLYYPIRHPVTGEEVLPSRTRVWAYSREEHLKHVADNRIWWGQDGKARVPAYKRFLKDMDGRVPQTLWSYTEVGHNQDAVRELAEVLTEARFGSPKPNSLIRRVLQIATSNIVLDYFAGSGTTGHALINLNREDAGRRKFILVEMADYFDTVLVPRIKKVMFTPEWKEGKPKRVATKEEAERTPRLVKVLRLESYEDALHNTFSDSNIERLSGREKAFRQVVGDEEYRIRYLVKLPLEASDAMLNLSKLEHPFDYTIKTLSDYGSKAQTVDLVETFNWLYGLRVKRILTWANEKDKIGKNKEGRLYRAILGTDRDGKKRILVVWRDMTGLDPVKDREFLEVKAKEGGPFEEQWVNGESAAKDFASLDPLFKRLMTGDET